MRAARVCPLPLLLLLPAGGLSPARAREPKAAGGERTMETTLQGAWGWAPIGGLGVQHGALECVVV